MDTSLWMNLHGATAHFPIALVMASLLFDLAGSLVPDNPGHSRCAGFHAAGFYTIALALPGGLGAVASGLLITHGKFWGHGALARHRAFLWPGFGLLLGLAIWRLAVRNHFSKRAFKLYLTVSMLTAGLIGTAGHWGGEILLHV